MSRSTFSSTTVRDNPERDRYELFVGEELAGYLAYRRSDDRILISSTVVDRKHPDMALPATWSRSRSTTLVERVAR